MRRLLVFGAVILACPAVLGAEPVPAGTSEVRCALPQALERPVTNLLQALDGGDFAAARVSLGIVRDRSRSLGIQNLFPLSAAVRLWLSGKGTTAPSSDVLEVLDGVIDLAPDDPWLRLHRSRVVLGQGFGGISEAFLSLEQALQAFRRNPAASLQTMGHVAFLSLLSLVGCLLLVSLGILLRHFTRLAHDAGDLFPRAPTSAFSLLEMARSRGLRFLVGSGANRVLSGSLLAVVLFLPIVAGLGLIPTACLWTVLLVPYLRPAERVGAAFSLVSVAGIPWIAAWALLPGRVLDGDGAALWTALQGTPRPGAEEQVLRRGLERPEDPWAALVRSRIDARRSPLSVAVLQGNRTRLAAATPDPQGVVATEMGHTELRLSLADCGSGRPDREAAARALSAYREALARAPGRPEILEAMALASALQEDVAGTRDALKNWTAASPEEELERVAAWKPLLNPADACREALRLDRELRLPPFSAWNLYLLEQAPWLPADTLPFQSALTGRIPVSWLPVLGVAGLLILVVLSGLGNRLHFASRCPRCGQVSCPSCNRAATGFDYCPTCLFEQVRPAFLDPGERMARGEQSFKGFQRRARLILGLLVPGLGQVLDGRPIRGTVFLLLLAGALVSVTVPASPIVDPLFFSGVGPGLPVLPPVVLATVFLVSAIDLWRFGRS
ncbi:MAG TPA: hypothetical protein PLQ97_02565 [Myxococcota bacterium]|nr:hypothetical protein [Myxococcota bacterium]HQK50713.1 hypothetical protein [Myxococcota bacterium]